MDAYHIIWGNILILSAILAPGTALSLVVAPKLKQIKLAERVGLALVLGLIPQVILYFMSKNMNVAITETSVWASILGVTAFGLIYWKVKRG